MAPLNDVMWPVRQDHPPLSRHRTLFCHARRRKSKKINLSPFLFFVPFSFLFFLRSAQFSRLPRSHRGGGTGRLSQRDGFGKNPLSNALSQTSFRHDIDAASQEPLQIENQRRVIHKAPDAASMS